MTAYIAGSPLSVELMLDMQRLTVLAIKHCPNEHHDWNELAALSYKYFPDEVS